MDDREQFVLNVRATATDLIEDDSTRAPDRRWRLDVLEAAINPRHGEPDQVIEVEQAGVVVPELQPQGFGNPGQEQAFGRPVRANQQQWSLSGQGGE